MFNVKKEIAEPYEKVRVTLPTSTIAWVKSLGDSADKTEDKVLQEAIAYARQSNETGAVAIAIPEAVRQFAELKSKEDGIKVEAVLVGLLQAAVAKATAKAAKKGVEAP